MIEYLIGAGVASLVFAAGGIVAYWCAEHRFYAEQQTMEDAYRRASDAQKAVLSDAMGSAIARGEARLARVRADLDNAQAELSKLRDSCAYWKAKANRKNTGAALAAIKARTTAELAGRHGA